jgi:hypothetical protein
MAPKPGYSVLFMEICMENPLFIKRTAAIETDRDDKDPSKTLMAQGLPIE